MKCSFTLVLSIICLVLSEMAEAQVMFPPENLQVDPITLTAQWSKPHNTILEENFEGLTFPPAGWMSTTQGVGWFVTNHTTSLYPVPPHTYYAVATDQIPGQPNNGCCDYLITPILNLSEAPGYKLVFLSYFSDVYFQSLAYVKMSIDNGINWTTISTLTASNGWKQVVVDLSPYSGVNGLTSVRFAFHSDCYITAISGWAIDDVKISSEAMQVTGYNVYVGDSLVTTTTELSCQIPPSLAYYGDTITVYVAAGYAQGISAKDSVSFVSQYLFKPNGLQVTSTGNQAHLTWNPPFDSVAGSVPPNLINYNVYRAGQLLTTLDNTMTGLWVECSTPDTVCFEISALYDLTAYGYPGQIGESLHDGPACVFIHFGYELPFTEDWAAGQFGSNQWVAEANWAIDQQAGNPVPSVIFKGLPLLANYEKSLESYWIDASTITTTTPYKIWLDFDLKRNADSAISADEKLSVEVWVEGAWVMVQEFGNTGLTTWTTEHLLISPAVKNRVFKFRFRAHGLASNHIISWEVDNIKVYTELLFPSPTNLYAFCGATDDFQLTWQAGISATLKEYVLDDGSAENVWSISQGAEAWLGNEFAVSESGVLQSLDLYWEMNASAGSDMLTVDIFNSNQDLIGSSAPFSTVNDAWQSIPLPDVPFDGTYYAMVHWNNTAAASDYLGSDENGPNASDNYGWYYDGASWVHLSNFGYAHNVFMLRATTLIGVDHLKATFGKVSINNTTRPTRTLDNFPQLSSKPGRQKVISPPAKFKSTNGLMGYQVYRRDYTKFPPAPNPGVGDFELIATVNGTAYTDYNVPFIHNNCFEYFVKAVYDEGISGPSNIDWSWVKVGLEPEIKAEITVAPNPANSYVSLQFPNSIQLVQLFNYSGIMVFEQKLKGETSLQINTTAYPQGVYVIRFSNGKSESVIRKLVVAH